MSIGLPVYNGDNYLDEAIRSILEQTFTDFELIICDNASTDRTAQICLDHAARDPRVRYYYNERNLGAGPNFNRAFELARGEYFRWAAHDDLLAPTYLERCVDVLDADPGVVLCHTLTQVIGDRGEGLARELQGLDHDDVVERFEVLTLQPHWCLEIFGLMRAAALRRTGLYRPYFGTDKTVLVELALQGRFQRVQEPLFLNRDHPERSLRAVAFHKRQDFHVADRQGRSRMPTWALYTDYLRAIPRHVEDRGARLACYGTMLKWWFANWHVARLGLDLVCLIEPEVVSNLAYRARSWYHRRAFGVR